MHHTFTVSAAYFRDFKSKKEILNYWNSNRDFQNLDIFETGYINKQDAKKYKVGFLNVRYRDLRNIAVIDVSKDSIK